MTSKQRVALFIDAENASSGHLPAYLQHCRALGKLTIVRCYGNAAALKGWEAAIAQYHLMPVQTPPGTGKANASDFALTIDAVSLLHRNLFDYAVIASSDADFTLLAVHIREHGKGIDGIGEAKARESLRSAFDCFTVVGTLEPQKPSPQEAASTPVKTLTTPLTMDTADFMAAAKSLLATGSKTTLASLGKHLKARMGDSYPNGKLSKHIGKHPTVFKIEGITIERLK